MTINEYKIERKEDLELLLMKISKTKGARHIRRNEMLYAMHYKDCYLKFDCSSVVKHEFFKDLNSHLKKKLIFNVFHHYIVKFHYIFEDPDVNYSASDTFKYEIIKNLKC